MTTPRVSPRAVSMSMPSISARTSTAASEKECATSARAAKMAASPRYSAGSTARGASWSRCAVNGGAANAGRNCMAMNSAAVASGSRVSS